MAAPDTGAETIHGEGVLGYQVWIGGERFEHSVANMTVFGLAALEGSATWELARNLLWTVPGNIVGGGLLVGVADSWLNGAAAQRLWRRRRADAGATADDDPADADVPEAQPTGEPTPAAAASQAT